MRWCSSGMLAITIAAVAVPGWAQEVDCETAEAQQELTWCAEQDWIAADADLNAAYAAARGVMRDIDAALPKAEQGAAGYLKAAQTAWIALRDAGCAAEGYVAHGGSLEPMLIYGCWARMSAARAEDLWQLAETN